MEPDPIKLLHTALAKGDLLSDKNKDENNFRSLMSSTAGRKQVYEFMKANDMADIEFDAFESQVTAKKKSADGASVESSQPSSSEAVPAQNAAANTGSDPFLPGINTQGNPEQVTPGTDPFVPQLEQPAPDPVTELPTESVKPFVEVDTQNPNIPEIKKEPATEPSMMAGVEMASESTAAPVIQGESNLYTPTNLTGDEDALAEGQKIQSGKFPAFEKKRAYAEKAPMRKAAFELNSIGEYAEAARKQELNTAEALRVKFGDDWSKKMVEWGQIIEADDPKWSASEKEAIKSEFNAIVNDDDYQKYAGALKARDSAWAQFKGYADKNPEYAKKLAQQKASEKKTEDSSLLQAATWIERKSAKVVAGIASMPRTVINAVDSADSDNPAAQIANSLGDWADSVVENSDVRFAAPKFTERPLWEKMAPFKEMDVVVDDSGQPVSAWKGNKSVALTDDMVKEFNESGAAKDAKNKFTGVANGVGKLADVVADLYVMRYLGQGTLPGTMTSAFAIQHRDTYEEGMRDLDLSPEQAAQYALAKTAANSAIEALVGGIEMGPAKMAAAKAAGIKEAKAIAGKASSWELAKASMKPVLKELGAENTEELLQGMSDNMTAATFNSLYGSHLKGDTSMEEVGETVLLTSLATLIGGSADMMRGAKGEYTQNAYMAALQNQPAFEKALAMTLESGAISPEEATAAQERVSKLSSIYSKLPSYLTQKQKAEVMGLELERLTTEVQYENTQSEAQAKIADEQNIMVDEKIAAIVAPETVEEAATEPVAKSPVAEPAPVSEPVAPPVEEVVAELVQEAAPEPTVITKNLTPVADVAAPEKHVWEMSNAEFSAIFKGDPKDWAGLVDSGAISRDLYDEAIRLIKKSSDEVIPDLERTIKMPRGSDLHFRALLNAKKEGRAVSESLLSEYDQSNPVVIETPSKELIGLTRAVPMESRVTAPLSEIAPDTTATVTDVVAAYGENTDELVDDATNLALNLLPGKQKATATDIAAMRDFVSDNVTDPEFAAQNGSFQDAVRSLAEEFSADRMSGRGTADNRLRAGFEPQTLDDFIADEFLSGTRLSYSEISKDVQEVKDGKGTRLAYTTKAGTPLDVVAQAVYDRFYGQQSNISGTDTTAPAEIAQMIRDFISANPTGAGDHARMMKEKAIERELEGQGSVDEVKAAVAESGAAVSEMSEKDKGSLQSLLDSYTDGDVLDTARLLDDFEAWDPFSDPASLFNQLTPKALQTLTKAHEHKTPIVAGESDAGIQEETQPTGEAQANQSEPVGTGDAIEAPLTDEESLQTVELPTELTPELIQELRTEGIRNPTVSDMETVRTVTPEEIVAEGPGFTISRIGDTIYISLPPEIAHSLPVTFNAETGRYEAPAALQNEIILSMSQMGSAEKMGVGKAPVNGETAAALSTPKAAIQRNLKKIQFRKAKSFEERLAIAAMAHKLSGIDQGSALRKSLEAIQAWFPNVEIVVDTKAVDAKKKELGITGSPLGFTVDGIIYVDVRIARPDTGIHELGHLWEDWLEKNNPTLHAKGVELAKASDYLAAVKANPEYAGLSEADQIKEAMAMAIGERGALMLDNSTAIRFKRWLGEMWNSIRLAFGGDYQHGTLAEFADAQVRRMKSEGATIDLTGTPDVQLQTDPIVAAQLEAIGESPEKIFALTGWFRNPLGTWSHTDSAFGALTYDLRESNSGIVGEFLDAPDFFRMFDVSGTSISFGKENADGISVPEDATAMDIVNALREKILSEYQLPEATIGDNATGDLSMGEDYAARMLAVSDLLKVEIWTDGLKGMKAKVKAIAQKMELSEQTVLRLLEKEAFALGMGQVVIDKNEIGGKAAKKRVDDYMVDYIEKYGKWFFEYFRPRGLMEREIYAADQKRIGKIAKQLRHAEDLIADLERAMKDHYKKDLDDTHWQIVDNVLRGEGDWSVLPSGIEQAARAVRAMTDSITKLMVANGVVKGHMVITLLGNAGVKMNEDLIKSYHGVNVHEALEKLPFERTAIEQEAIKDFLEEYGTGLGNYMYRSYRVHDDLKWKDKVSPRAYAEAKAYLQGQAQKNIENAIAQRDIDVEKIDNDIATAKAEVVGLVNSLNAQVETAKAKLKELADQQSARIAEGLDPSQTIERSYASWQKKLRQFEKNAKKGAEMSLEDFDVLELLGTPEFARLFVAGKQIVGLRRKIAALNEKKSGIDSKMSEKILPDLYHALNNVDGMIKDMLEPDDAPVAQLSRGILGSKDQNILKARQEIAPEIRELLGEYKDPRVKFAKSMYRMVSLLENHRFLAELKHSYTDRFFFEKQTNEAYKQIASEGSFAMNPLNGMYTTPDIKNVFDEYYSAAPGQDGFFKAAARVVAFVKYGKTILSPVTHGRNFFGNLWFVINNGYDLRHGGTASMAFPFAWKRKLSEDKQAYMEKLIELRVVGNGAHIGALNDLMNAMNSDNVEAFVNTHIGNKVNNVRELIQETYGAEDDFYRILAFETEKSRYSKAWYKAKFEELTKAEQDAVEARAAELVIGLLPTYSKVPKAVRWFQRFPFTGTFVAFPAEMFRVTANQLKVTRQELADPRLRHIGIRRALGMGMAQVGLSVGLTSLFKFLHGVTDDEDDAARYFMFEWQQDATLLWESLDPNAEMSFKNLSFIDPFAFIKRPVTRMLTDNNETFMQNLGGAAYSLVEPFLSPELTYNTFDQLEANQSDKTKRAIYNPLLGMWGDKQKVLKFIAWNLQPGVAKLGMDLYSSIADTPVGGRPPKSMEEILVGMAGLQTEKRTVRSAVDQKSREMQKSKEYARQIFTADRWQYKDDPKALNELFQTAKVHYNKVLKEAAYEVLCAKTIGMAEKDITSSLLTAGFSVKEKDAIYGGYELTPQFDDYNK